MLKGAKVSYEGDSVVPVAKEGNNFPIQQHGRIYYLCKTSSSEGRSETLEMRYKLHGHCNFEDV